MSELVSFTRDGDVAVITINNPPVNAMSPGVPEGIAAGIEQLETDPTLKAAVLIGGGRTFIAGADITKFAQLREKGEGVQLNVYLNKVEAASKPVVCAIHGTAFGGGLETAMSCHYRVALASAQVGQPEVKLGLIPGAGGTQRLPRLAGVAKAMELCAVGDPVKAPQALELGIIDKIIEGDLLAGAVAFAREAAAKPTPRTRERNDKLAGVDPAALAAQVKGEVAKKLRGQIAPQKAVDAVEAATRLPFDEGLAYERQLFNECLQHDQSKGLIHAFFGEREVAKVPGIGKDTPVKTIERAAVIGAGTMGGGIAMVFANAGIPVLLKETEQAALDRGLNTIRKNYENSVKKGRFSQAEMDARMGRIQPTLSYDGFESVDIIVEAVFEGMDLKKQIFSTIDNIAKEGCILASNTSTLSIDEIASATTRPSAVIGTHFFSPANVMRLLEIVRGKESSLEVINTCMQLSKKLGKVGVLVGNCRGFVGNRMFGPYRREAQFLAEEGASVQAIDAALYKWGMAMGPLSTGDLAGLDVGWRIRKEFKHLEDPSKRAPIAEDKLCEMGRYGQKTQRGWYLYDENRKASPDPELPALLKQWAAEKGIPQRNIDEQEIIDRCIYALVNEGARILEEGYALRSVDIDIIYLSGYGFPAWRGGPMFYADTVGLKKVYERICEFEKQHGAWWTPAPLLKKLAEEGKTFTSYVRAAAHA
jgi:3-hydroxyacyl-CoA dehydrogenase